MTLPMTSVLRRGAVVVALSLIAMVLSLTLAIDHALFGLDPLGYDLPQRRCLPCSS
jgi:hypothetical protein